MLVAVLVAAAAVVVTWSGGRAAVAAWCRCSVFVSFFVEVVFFAFWNGSEMKGRVKRWNRGFGRRR